MGRPWKRWKLPRPDWRENGGSRRSLHTRIDHYDEPMARLRFPRFTRKDLERFGPLNTAPESENELALVLTGGGARGAYQVGMIRSLARHFPDLRIPIITGVSAGAVNAVHLAAHHGTLSQAAEELTALWSELTTDKVFRTDWGPLTWSVARWGARLLSGGLLPAPEVRGLVDTEPLHRYLAESMAAIEGEITGIDYNLHRGTLKAVAVATTNYTTGQNVVFVQGRDFETWERPYRKSVQTKLRVEHVMASAALPGFFPAIQIGDHWYGDGGIRLTAPLSPALHLGARRILSVSTRFEGSQEEGDAPEISGYPPPAQIMGALTQSVFLDTLDQDARRLKRLNEFIDAVPRRHRRGLRPVDILVLRPSRDLSRLARDYEPRLPRGFRFLTRGLGTTKTGSPDVLAMMMFQPDYLRRLIELGESDTEDRLDELRALVGEGGAPKAKGAAPSEAAPSDTPSPSDPSRTADPAG
jgi:NTE family protein